MDDASVNDISLVNDNERVIIESLHVLKGVGFRSNAVDYASEIAECILRLKAEHSEALKRIAQLESIVDDYRAREVAAESVTKLSAAERHVLEHSLAWPKQYRNHFCASIGHSDWETLQALCTRGLMCIGRRPSELSEGDTVFIVTGAGIDALKGNQ